MNWFENAVFYHIYPIGYFGCPRQNDFTSEPTHKILKVIDDIPHIKELGCNAVYFGPVFESSAHGYDTADYTKIDRRLGTNEDFKKVCDALHENGIRVVLDGVFNHVGRDFWAFRDVRENKLGSAKKDWFHVREGNDGYNDGFWYEGWEGNYDLVKLNLKNDEVVNYLFDCVKYWIEYFEIDGIRLDVAYCLDPDFMHRLRGFTDSLKNDFFLVGETVHGDYNRLVNDGMLHSATNYECYKGIHSAINSLNLFEIVHSLLRQFGPEEWTLYKGKHMLSFVDNHDVSRIASVINNEKNLPLAYAFIFGMPGIPCVYYGSEWGFKADKSQGDPALRPYFENYEENALTDIIAGYAKVKKESKALNYGNFYSLLLTNRQCVFGRWTEEETVLVGINIDDNEFKADFNAGADKAVNMITGETVDIANGFTMKPNSAYFLRLVK